MNPDEMFATIVGVLAALAVIGALVFVIVVEVVAIRHKLTAHRRPSSQESAESFRLDAPLAVVVAMAEREAES